MYMYVLKQHYKLHVSEICIYTVLYISNFIQYYHHDV